LPDADLALLAEAARAAGEIALSYFRKAPDVWDKGSGLGPVTAADLAVDAMLRERLRAARPGYGWLSEETADAPDRLSARRCFIVDPIDGTRAFIAGEPSWSHSLAVCEDGRPVAGVVFLPVKERLYAAAAGAGATRDGAPIRVSGGGRTVLASSASLRAERWPGGPPPLDRHFRPSLAFRLSLVAEGRFDAMLTLDPAWEWDIAAGALIAAEAGATVSDRHGASLVFNRAEPRCPGVVVAPPTLHATILGHLVEPRVGGT
jgi:myo-inositol-1(or 4)-monophosphatase